MAVDITDTRAWAIVAVIRYKVTYSKEYDGYKYHYEWDGEKLTSFNYWPNIPDALNGAVYEIWQRVNFIKTMKRIEANLKEMPA